MNSANTKFVVTFEETRTLLTNVNVKFSGVHLCTLFSICMNLYTIIYATLAVYIIRYVLI
jgi:hypothetical protein